VRRQSPTRWIAALPLWAALAFVGLFVCLPLLVLLGQTVLGPDGPTLEAWRELLQDEHDVERLLASLRLGLAATAISLLLGGGHAWVSIGRDLPLGRAIAPLGVVPLVVPPIFVAMGFADLAFVDGFWPCAVLLGVAHAPFVAVLAARGLRSIDGRAYEAAWLLRGRGRAELWLLRAILPEVVAGCLLAFIFTVSDHGVPEFLTVKGKTWHTYAEGIFARWSRRATGTTFADLQSPIVAALPFIATLGITLWLALRLRSHGADRGTSRPLPPRPLGSWRWPALLLPIAYLTCGVGIPVFVLARWALGSAQRIEPMGIDFLRQSYSKAMDQGWPDLVHSVLLAVGAAALVLMLALPIARYAARRRPLVELVAAMPVAMPAILLGIGLVRTFFDSPVLQAIGGDFYAGWGFALCGYAARFLPFAVITLGTQVRRLPVAAEEAAALVGRSPMVRALRIHLPPLLPASWTAAVLVFVLSLRELDLAVVLPAANATAVRRLANAVHFQHEDWSGVIALMLLGIAILLPLLPSLIAGRRLTSLS
jgi:iron(III) transport system permease protein